MKIGITQYKTPKGSTEQVFAEVPEDVGKLADGMILSCEILSTGEIAIYVRRKEDDETDEEVGIAINSMTPNDPNGPTAKLCEMIRRIASERAYP